MKAVCHYTKKKIIAKNVSIIFSLLFLCIFISENFLTIVVPSRKIYEMVLNLIKFLHYCFVTLMIKCRNSIKTFYLIKAIHRNGLDIFERNNYDNFTIFLKWIIFLKRKWETSAVQMIKQLNIHYVNYDA